MTKPASVHEPSIRNPKSSKARRWLSLMNKLIVPMSVAVLLIATIAVFIRVPFSISTLNTKRLIEALGFMLAGYATLTLVSSKVFGDSKAIHVTKSIQDLDHPSSYTNFDDEFNQDLNKSLSKISGMELYHDLANDSRGIAKTLFDRSGVYLIVGVITALGGIGLFKLGLEGSIKLPKSDFTAILAIVPNTSILILCELVAFFFLRQSRYVLDEFRYFDRIARNREEILAILQMAHEENVDFNVKDVFDRGLLFSKADKLTAGESTEGVEFRKLEKSEVDLLTRMAELLSVIKPK